MSDAGNETQFSVGDIVYRNKRGWSDVPYEVVGIEKISIPLAGTKHTYFSDKEYTYVVVCESLVGLFSMKYDCRIERFNYLNVRKKDEPKKLFGQMSFGLGD